jgi:hypothetical protein
MYQILTGALGVVLGVTVFFRRVARATRHLTHLRVERDCERILREIGHPNPVVVLNERGELQGGNQTHRPAPLRHKRNQPLHLGETRWSRTHDSAAGAGTPYRPAAPPPRGSARR